jgi:hypothetical protein
VDTRVSDGIGLLGGAASDPQHPSITAAPPPTLQTLIVSLMFSRLDYGNAVLVCIIGDQVFPVAAG